MPIKTLTILLFPLILHASSHDRAQKFFVDHYEAAEQLYFCDGIPIQLSLGVWALESGYGSSTAAQRNNLAGIASYKGGKHWKRFANKAEFYRAFASIFRQPCYRNDLRPKTVGEYLEAMEWGCCSYHRSKEYTHKIKWIIKRYKLDKMEFSYKENDVEVRSTGEGLCSNPDHNTAEIVQWASNKEDKPYCWTVAYWIKEKEGYNLIFVSKRPLVIKPKLFMKMVKRGQKHLDKYFSKCK